MRKTMLIVICLLLSVRISWAQNLKPFEDSNGKYGYKDGSGKIVVQPKYDLAYEFQEGLALVNSGGKSDGFFSFEGGKY